MSNEPIGARLVSAYDLAAQQCQDELVTARRELRAAVEEESNDALATAKARRVASLTIEHRQLMDLASHRRQLG